jgi:transaldolase
MKLFLDTAMIGEIREADAWGVLDGVTTNPSLVSKTGREFKEVAQEILKQMAPRPVSLETVSTEAAGMVREARLLASWGDNVIAKIPFGPEGLKAIRALKAEGIRTNCTLVFSVPQGLLAAKAGAFYVSPFLGRLDDIGHDGMQVVRDLAEIFAIYGIETSVLAASIRHPLHLVEAAKAGADIATLPFAVLQQSLKHPLTDIGSKRFLDDWAKVPGHERVFVAEAERIIA